MGVKLKEIITAKEISLEDLKGKVIAIDSMNILYQFLTTIRQRDGTLLKDSKGNVTSHLNGLFYRTTKLMSQGIKLAFVFDGKPPKIKHTEIQKRKKRKKEAKELYEQAKKAGNIEAMRKYAGRTVQMTKEYVKEAISLLEALGAPVIQAPSEGEAQASYIVKKGDAYASGSQDYDNLLFGSPRLIRNLSIEGKKKKNRTLTYTTVKPEMIVLKDVLKNLGINQDQLIAMGVLMGTDFNPGGIPGIGPKKALKIVREHKKLDKIFESAKWSENFEIEWKEIFDTIKKIPVTEKYSLKPGKIDDKKVEKLLVDKHDFGEQRIKDRLQLLRETEKYRSQRGLGEWS